MPPSSPKLTAAVSAARARRRSRRERRQEQELQAQVQALTQQGALRGGVPAGHQLVAARPELPVSTSASEAEIEDDAKLVATKARLSMLLAERARRRHEPALREVLRRAVVAGASATESDTDAAAYTTSETERSETSSIRTIYGRNVPPNARLPAATTAVAPPRLHAPSDRHQALPPHPPPAQQPQLQEQHRKHEQQELITASQMAQGTAEVILRAVEWARANPAAALGIAVCAPIAAGAAVPLIALSALTGLVLSPIIVPSAVSMTVAYYGVRWLNDAPPAAGAMYS